MTVELVNQRFEHMNMIQHGRARIKEGIGHIVEGAKLWAVAKEFASGLETEASGETSEEEAAANRKFQKDLTDLQPFVAAECVAALTAPDNLGPFTQFTVGHFMVSVGQQTKDNGTDPDSV